MAYGSKQRFPKKKARSYARRATVRKPYGGSRYGNDAFVKVEKIVNLSTSTGTVVGEVFSTMRQDQVPTGATPGNSYLAQQAEFAAFSLIYARYEVVGMKAEVTLSTIRYPLQAANLAGGLAPNIPNPAPFPSQDNNNSYPMQTDCNT